MDVDTIADYIDNKLCKVSSNAWACDLLFIDTTNGNEYKRKWIFFNSLQQHNTPPKNAD